MKRVIALICLAGLLIAAPAMAGGLTDEGLQWKAKALQLHIELLKTQFQQDQQQLQAVQAEMKKRAEAKKAEGPAPKPAADEKE